MDSKTGFEELLEQAGNCCRGRMMTQEEWNRHYELYIHLGHMLAPCRPPQVDVVDDSYNRAMELLKGNK